MSKRTSKNPKNWHNTPVFLCWHGKKFESNKRQWISFRPQRWGLPYRNHHACCERSSGCEKLIPKPAPNGTIFLPRHVDAVPWYHVKFHEFLMSFRFTRMLKACISMLAAERQCQGVWHSFSFLACDLSLQPRTNIWFCNPFLWTGACGLILNCATEMPRKPSYHIQRNPEQFHFYDTHIVACSL